MRLTTLRKNQSFTIASPSYLPILLYLNVWSFEMIVLDCLHKHILTVCIFLLVDQRSNVAEFMQYILDIAMWRVLYQ